MKFESSPSEGTIVMRGVIGDFYDAISRDDFSDALAEHDGQDVKITINSEGGSLYDGLGIYNELMRYPGNVHVHVDVLAASIATIISCAADRLTIDGNARFMIHRAWLFAMGNADDFRSLADLLEKADRDLAGVYAEKSGNDDIDHWMDLMSDETWMTANEAFEAGLVDEVLEITRKRGKDSGDTKALAISPFAIAAKARSTAARMKLRL